MRYEVYTGFNPDKMIAYFDTRRWPVETIQRGNVNLVAVTRGAALECGDGRFDQLKNREAYGVRILGGVNAIMAMHTGGNTVGLLRATELLKRFGATPGTHSADEGGCGYADLWMAGKLESAVHPYEFVQERGGLKLGAWLKSRMELNGGKHFILNGNHLEEAVRLNPFRRLTEVANDGRRFRIDDWFMADMGFPDELRWFKIAETVEQLKPEAARLEIIVP